MSQKALKNQLIKLFAFLDYKLRGEMTGVTLALG